MGRKHSIFTSIFHMWDAYYNCNEPYWFRFQGSKLRINFGVLPIKPGWHDRDFSFCTIGISVPNKHYYRKDVPLRDLPYCIPVHCTLPFIQLYIDPPIYRYFHHQLYYMCLQVLYSSFHSTPIYRYFNLQLYYMCHQVWTLYMINIVLVFRICISTT